MVYANEVLARRVVLRPAPQIDGVPFKELLAYDHIQRTSTLSTNQQIELLNLLNQYRSCFALSMSELGCTNLEEMNIGLKPNSEPFAAKPYRVSSEERAEIDQHVQR